MSFIVDCILWLLAAVSFIFPSFVCAARQHKQPAHNVDTLDLLLSEVDAYPPRYQESIVRSYNEFGWKFDADAVMAVEQYDSLRKSGKFVPFELAASRIAQDMNMSLTTFIFIFEDAEIPSWMAADGHCEEKAIMCKREFLEDFYA